MTTHSVSVDSAYPSIKDKTSITPHMLNSSMSLSPEASLKTRTYEMIDESSPFMKSHDNTEDNSYKKNQQKHGLRVNTSMNTSMKHSVSMPQFTVGAADDTSTGENTGISQKKQRR